MRCRLENAGGISTAKQLCSLLRYDWIALMDKMGLKLLIAQHLQTVASEYNGTRNTFVCALFKCNEGENVEIMGRMFVVIRMTTIPG